MSGRSFPEGLTPASLLLRVPGHGLVPDALARRVENQRRIGTGEQPVLARQFGLETIPQAALANYHEVLRARLSIPDDEIIICGMGIGYPDTSAKVNSFTTDREPLENFVTWIDTLKQAKG